MTRGCLLKLCLPLLAILGMAAGAWAYWTIVIAFWAARESFMKQEAAP